MFEIFKAEFNRYRKWALIAFIGQLALWALIMKLKPLLQPSDPQTFIIFLLCMLGGAGFGVVQMIMHTRKNNWTWLIQRPLHHWKIYQALSAAGFVLLVLAVPMAWLLVVAGMDLVTNTVVDMRHYLYGLYMLGVALTAYLVGSLIVLNASRGAFLLIALMILWLIPSPYSQLLHFGLMGLIMAGLWYLNLKSFKPNRHSHLSSPVDITLMAVPMQFALAIALFLSSAVFYHIPLFIMGTHPDNNPVKGSMSYLWHLDDGKKVGYILKDHDILGKDRLARQAELADKGWINSRPATWPSKNQMFGKDYGYGLVDGPSRTRWIFSNDQMLLKGTNMLTGEMRGWMGRQGFVDAADITDQDRFETVPFMLKDRFLVTPKRIYQVDYETRELTVKYDLPAGTTLFNMPTVEENYVALVTTKSLLLFDKQDFLAEGGPEEGRAEPIHTVTHPLPVAEINTLETARMVDGQLVLYYSKNYNGYDKQAVSIHYARFGKPTELVAKTDYMINRHPPVIMDLTYVSSPARFMIYNQILHWIEPSNPRNPSFKQVMAYDMDRTVVWGALGLMILSAVITFLMARKIKLSRQMIGFWTVLSLIMGLPALISFFLMNRVRGG